MTSYALSVCGHISDGVDGDTPHTSTHTHPYLQISTFAYGAARAEMSADTGEDDNHHAPLENMIKSVSK